MFKIYVIGYIQSNPYFKGGLQMALQKAINELKNLKSKGNVLTVYLNTDRSECQSGSWNIRLKNGLKKLEEYISLSSGENELKDFKKVKRKVENTISNAKTNLQKSVVIFASTKDKFYSVHFLQVSVENEFFWEKYPILTQIEKVQATYPTSGVVIANEDEITLMHSELGKLDVVNQYYFEPNTEDWRLFEGVAASDRIASGAKHRDSFKDRYEANQHRWLRSMMPIIEKKAKQFNWEHVHIIGQADYLTSLENELKLPIKSVLRKTVSNNTQKKMIYKEIIAM